MSYPLTLEEFQTIQAQDAETRYHHFLTQVATHGEVWILKDDEGCLSLESDGETYIPMWPHEDYAKAWAGDAFEDFEPYAIPVKTWLNRWVSGMAEDGVAMAVFPSTNGDGVVESPEVVADDLIRKQGKLSNKK